MKKIIGELLLCPKNFEELKKSEKLGLRLVSFLFFLTAGWLVFVFVSKWNTGSLFKNMGLGFINILNIVGFFVSSYIAFRLSNIVDAASSVNSIANIKKMFYMVYFFIIGIPYLSMTGWLLQDNDINTSMLLLFIFIGSLIGLYLFDWKKFIKIKSRISEF